MSEFELTERDGLARLGRIATPHGLLETPALLPVVHPDPTRQPIPPREIRRRFGFGAVITSAYITWRTPELRARAEADGIHGLLDFDGPVMTDSGAFQQHAYGHVEVEADEILGFQRRIGSDIATVLDVFVEPDAPLAAAEAGVATTTARARAARELTRGLLAVPVQGGRYPELRRRSAAEASETGDVLAVGGVVPLLEEYRFAELARVLLAARPALAPEKLVHLFGTGHPAAFAFGALFGVDLFDSASYHKFARRGALLFPDGTVDIARLREPICRCALCAEMPLTEVARRSPPERERRIAEHNLAVCAAEMARVRQAIRDGGLWELAERRATAHPGLLAGLRAAVRGARVFLPTEPESRRGFRVAGATSGLRPSVIRFLARLAAWREGKGPHRAAPRGPLVPSYLRRLPAEDADGRPVRWEATTPLGAVPVELTEIYPVGGYVGLEAYDPPEEAPPADTEEAGPLARDDPLPAWTRRHAEGVLEWTYGAAPAAALVAAGLVAERSRRSGRLRRLHHDGRPAFVFGADGLARPTFVGGELLRTVLPAPQARLVVAPDAVPFVAEGRSLFSRFVRGGDAGLVPGQSALLVDDDDRLLAVGRLLLAPGEIGRLARGVACRVTAHARAPLPADAADDGPDDAPADGEL